MCNCLGNITAISRLLQNEFRGIDHALFLLAFGSGLVFVGGFFLLYLDVLFQSNALVDEILQILHHGIALLRQENVFLFQAPNICQLLLLFIQECVGHVGLAPHFLHIVVQLQVEVVEL